MTINKGLFSSASPEWATPQDLFDRLNKEYVFTLDPCASAWNAKCPKYFTKEQNGLLLSWYGERVFMNPPYGREIGKWIAKAYKEVQDGAHLAVCLLPARTDTRWWQEYVMKVWPNGIEFLAGRLKFVGQNGTKTSAPFPSAIVTFLHVYKDAVIEYSAIGFPIDTKTGLYICPTCKVELRGFSGPYLLSRCPRCKREWSFTD